MSFDDGRYGASAFIVICCTSMGVLLYVLSTAVELIK